MAESSDGIVTHLHQWRARHHPDRERWPMPASFADWLTATRPGPREPCAECGTWSLRHGAPPDNPSDEKTVCTNPECDASPFHRPV